MFAGGTEGVPDQVLIVTAVQRTGDIALSSQTDTPALTASPSMIFLARYSSTPPLFHHTLAKMMMVRCMRGPSLLSWSSICPTAL